MMIFWKNKVYLIEFKQELSFGHQIVVTAPSEEEALNLVFDKIFHHQTIPAVNQVGRLSKFEFLKKVGFWRFLKAIRKKKSDYWI